MPKYKSIQQWYDILSSRLKGIPRESIRFYSLEAFPRLMHYLETHKKDCPECAEHFRKLDEMSYNMGQWMKNDMPEVKIFQKELEGSVKHLRAHHKVFPRGLWLSRFVFFGILVGILGALVTVFFVAGLVIGGILLTGGFIGMLVGWIAGKNKERRIKKQDRLF